MSNLPPTQTPQRPADSQQRPVEGQQPVQGQRPPQGQQQRPAQGQRPPQGQQQRPAQGQRPPQGQQQRPAQGQRPPQGQQQRPAQGQRPPQGQQIPAQGQRPPQGQQRPMRGQQTRPQNTFRRPKRNDSVSIKELLVIAVIAVSVLLIVALIAGVAVAAFNGAFDLSGLFDNNKGGYTDSGDKDNGDKDSVKPSSKPSAKPSDTSNVTDKTIVKADITLPSATPSGSYLSPASSGASQISGISSNAAVLVDVSSNSVIAGKNADARVYPASMTKVMTLLVACENATVAGKLLTVEQWMIDYQQKMGASGIMGFKAGEQISVENALYLINYNSDTVACLLIAEYVSGSEEAFVALMNKKAAALGLKNTHFMNTTGLHDDDHYTTCREMAAIMNCAMNNPVAGKIISSYSGRGISVYVNNIATRGGTVYAAWYSDKDRFGDDARIQYPKGQITEMTAIGGKTGYEDIPTACFVTIAEHKNGSRYICVTVGRTATTQGAVSPKQSTIDTEYIYANYANK